MTVVPGESTIDLMAGPRGEVHARPGDGSFDAARASTRLDHQTRFPGRFSAEPPQSAPDGQAHPFGFEATMPEPAEKPAALAAVSVIVRSSLTTQHGRSPKWHR